MQESITPTRAARKKPGSGLTVADKEPVSPLQLGPDRCEDDPEWVREQRFTEQVLRETGHL
jgi:hypothetical protein